jgi:hypothetical protein
MQLRVRTYGSAIWIFLLSTGTIACSSGELHSSRKDDLSPGGRGPLKAEIHTINENQDRQGPGSRQDPVSNKEGNGSQKSKESQGADKSDQSEQADQSMKNADNTALPPNNLAGAYLVQPKPAGCFWEKKSISNILLSLCGVSFEANRMPSADKMDANSNLQLVENEAGTEPIPVIEGNKVTGLIVNAMNPDQAASTTQEHFIASKTFVNAENRELDAETLTTFKLAPGKYIVYSRSELMPQTQKPTAMAMALELRKVIFSRTLLASNALSLGVILDKLVGNLLLKIGLVIAAPSTGLGLIGDSILETGKIKATSLVKSNVETDLTSNKMDFDILFPANK